MARKANSHKQLLQQLEDEFRRKTQLLDDLRRENVELHCKQDLLSELCQIIKNLQQQTYWNTYFTTATEQLLLEQLKGLPPRSTIPDKEKTSVSTATTLGSSPSRSGSDSGMATLQNHCTACTTISNGLVELNSSALPCGITDSGPVAGGAQAATAEDRLEFECAAPWHDPLCLLREALSQPQLGDEDVSVTIEELQADAIKTVKELSYLLYLHERGSYKTAYAVDDPARPRPLEQMRAELMRHCRLGSLACFGKNSETGFGILYSAMPFDGPGKARVPQEVNSALYASTVKQLGLSMDQIDRILLGVNAFKGVLHSIQSEMSALQQEVAALISSQHQQPKSDSQPPLSIAASQDAANFLSAFSSLYKHLGNTSESQNKLQRLHILLSKTFLVRCALLSYVYGCMTVVQCAQAFVGVSPFPLLVMVFCNAVAEYKQELQAQQQQQRSADATKDQHKVTICGVCATRVEVQQK